MESVAAKLGTGLGLRVIEMQQDLSPSKYKSLISKALQPNETRGTALYIMLLLCQGWISFYHLQSRRRDTALKLREWIISSKKNKEGEAKAQLSIIFLCVPVAPGKSKCMFAFPRNIGKLAYKLTPRWFGHLIHMSVFDSDNIFLHKLEHKLADLGGNTEKLYYTPASADAKEPS